MADPVRSPFSRVWTIEDRAGPAAIPLYQGQVRAQGLTLGFGARTAIREPSSDQYGQFKTIDSIRAEPDLPALALQARYQFTKDEFIRLARKGCAIDVQVHFGKCQDPRDFAGGWDKVLVLEGADFATITTDDLGALNQGDDAIVNEALDMHGLNAYEIKRLTGSVLAAVQVTNEVVDVCICDQPQCGICGTSSDGCQKMFAVQLRNTGSPGLPAQLIASADGGATILQRNIASMPVNQDPSAVGCVGSRLVLLSNGDCAIHYAVTANVLLQNETWTRTAAGLVCPTGAPNDLYSRGAAFTWICGNGGYIYFSSDITAGVTVQDAGVATAQNLNEIYFFDDLNGIAVGASNAVVYTTNGGASWASVTGPAVGVALNTCWMASASVWFVGTAGGRLFYTRNSGVTWIEKAFPGSGSGVVRSIVFATPTVGYLAHDTSANVGRVLRSIDGGASWYVLPEGTGSLPVATRYDAVAACPSNPDVAYAAGLDGGTDGQLIKLA